MKKIASTLMTVGFIFIACISSTQNVHAFSTSIATDFNSLELEVYDDFGVDVDNLYITWSQIGEMEFYLSDGVTMKNETILRNELLLLGNASPANQSMNIMSIPTSIDCGTEDCFDNLGGGGGGSTSGCPSGYVEFLNVCYPTASVCDTYGNTSLRVNKQEIILAILNPEQIYFAFRARELATSYVNLFYNRDGSNETSDAFRHGAYSAYLTKFLGAYAAEQWTDAHESSCSSGISLAMDLHNNEVGREIALEECRTFVYIFGVKIYTGYVSDYQVAQKIKNGVDNGDFLYVLDNDLVPTVPEE